MGLQHRVMATSSAASPASCNSHLETQTDEIRLKENEELKEPKIVEKPSERERTWVIYFIGFMVS